MLQTVHKQRYCVSPDRAGRVTDVRGQRAGVGEPVPAAAAVLGRARARLPRAPAAPAAAASVSTTFGNYFYRSNWPRGTIRTLSSYLLVPVLESVSFINASVIRRLVLQVRDHGRRVPVGPRPE